MNIDIVILIIGILFGYRLLMLLKKKAGISWFLLSALFFSFTIWYVLPILLSNIGYWYIFESLIKLSIHEYNYFAIAEVCFYLAILILLILSFKLKFKSIVLFYESDNLKWQKILLISYSVAIFLYNVFFRYDYLDNNDISKAENGALFLVSFFASYITSYFYVNIFVDGNCRKNRIYLILTFLYSLSAVFVSGGRIYLLSIIWIYVAMRYTLIQQKKRIQFVFPLIFLLVISSILLPIIASKRGGEQSAPNIDVSESIDLALFHLNLKLNSIAYSTSLITSDGVGFAGYKPYLGSVFKYIPRSVWANKPTPTSFDGTISGIPSRRIPYLLNFDNIEYSNVGCSSFIVSLWQGWGFVFVAIVINVIYLRLIICLFRHQSYWLKAIGFNLLFFPQLILTPSYGDNLIQKLLEVVVLILFLYCIGVLKIKHKKFMIKC